MYKDISDEQSKEILEKLIRVDTCQPEGHEEDIIPLIMSLLPEGLECTVVKSAPGRDSLVAKLDGREEKGGIAFLGHVDTVACGNADDWKYGPFDAVCEDGVLFGRGASDMKGGVAAMIMTAKHLAALPEKPLRPVYFCFTADEESGGLGVSSLDKALFFDGLDEMIVCEPSGEKVSFCEKGALWLRLDIRGVSSHASRPDLGCNAVEFGADFISRFREYIDGADVHPVLGSTTAAVTKFHGGQMTNIVPSEAYLEMDIRTVPGVSHEKLFEAAGDICRELQKKYSGAFFELSVLNDRPAIECAAGSPFREAITETAAKCGLDMTLRGHFFFTDASLVIPKHGIPFVIAGPGDDRQAHIINESIEIGSIRRFCEFYLEYLSKYYY